MFGMRSLTDRLIQHGRKTLENILHAGNVPKRVPFSRVPIPKHVGIQKFHAPVAKPSLTRQVFTGLFPRYAMQSAAAEWRRRAAKQLISGGLWRRARNLPVFAFVGIAFSKQQERDNLFAQIRDLHAASSKSSTEEQTYSLGSLKLGQLIAKGCHAAVYEARFIISEDDDISILPEPVESKGVDNLMTSMKSEEESNSKVSIIDYDYKLGTNDQEREDSDSEISIVDVEEADSDVVILDVDESDSDIEEPVFLHMEVRFNELDEDNVTGEQVNIDSNSAEDYNLAVKMMFNYDIESDAVAVSRAMAKEAVPICLTVGSPLDNIWHNGNHVKMKDLLPHPNIVWMHGVFVDSVPDLPDNTLHYPAALPPRLYKEGFGHNLTMFIVMKRYTCTLTEYLSKEKPSMATRCLILCQLLEGIVFLRRHGIAHRDLKSDNLLLDLSAGPESPILVISDFGCCLCSEGLQIPYVTSETSKGGNAALMAPEIASAVHGPRSLLDYRKSDLWAAGALTYEILGLENPFYRSSTKPSRLDSRTYRQEDLPELPDNTPAVVKRLTMNILNRDPNKRLSTDAAATVLQLHLWGPATWTQPNSSVGINAIQDWLVFLAAQVACHRTATAHTNIQNLMKQTFLSRISYENLESALRMIQTV